MMPLEVSRSLSLFVRMAMAASGLARFDDISDIRSNVSCTKSSKLHSV